MDHTPGQRQFRDIGKYETYAARGGRSLDEIRKATAWKIEKGTALNAVNRPALVALAQAKGIPLASHDDTTLGDVDLASGEGVALAEFPTTREAAEAAHGRGITVMMGAPNLLRGVRIPATSRRRTSPRPASSTSSPRTTCPRASPWPRS